LLGSVRLAHAQADLIVATNAEIVLPSNVDAINHFYFFTAVDDGRGISTPTITNLGYQMGPINRIDVYDDGEFTHATFEVAVSVDAPGPGESTNDCFTITCEGESVNPCFDVTRAPHPVPAPENIVPACVSMNSSLVRIVQPTAECRKDEYRVNLLMATS
jgi:hypothetical protein